MPKVRMIEGFYGIDEMGSASDYFLEPVVFPQTKLSFDYDSDDDGFGEQEVTITKEDELREWAAREFAEYRIWTMEVPEGAIVKEDDA